MKVHRVVACASLCFGLAAASHASADGSASSVLLPGQALFAGQRLVSDSCVYHLDMQTDGNLVLYASLAPNTAPYAVWSSYAHSSFPVPYSDPAYTILQTDGNLVEYDTDDNRVMWASNTPRDIYTELWIQNDGNVVLYPGTSPGSWAMWSTGTSNPPGQVPIGPAQCPMKSQYTQIEANIALTGNNLASECTNDDLACGNSCSLDYGGSCVGWTWAPPGGPGSCSASEGQCSFKSSVTASTAATGMVSGIVTTSVHSRSFGSSALPVQIMDANGGCLDLPNGNEANGTKVQIWACDPTGVNQTWFMDSQGAVHFGADQNKCLDLPNGLPIDQTQLQIWDCDNGASVDQQWSYQADDTIEKDGKCVELQGGSSANGTAVQLYDCNGTSGQHWSRLLGTPPSVAGNNQIIQRIPAVPIQLTDANGGCLDLPSGNTTNGTKLQIWACDSNGQNQAWYMDGAGAIHYGADTTKCIDLPNGQPIDQTQLQIWDCDNGATMDQQWSYEGDDTIEKDGKCVELRGGSASNGTAVQLYDCNGTSGQHWLPLGPQ